MRTPYHLSEVNNFSFEFITAQKVKYIAYFLEYVSLFSDYPVFADKIFAFNIDVIEGNADNSIADDRIGITIVEVFKLFFKKIENVVVYVCDSADERHLARKRKFDFWFWKYNDGSIVKEDGIAVIDDVEIFNSLLLNRNNPHLTAIIFAFKELNEKANEK